jgi:hypothetical protein
MYFFGFDIWQSLNFKETLPSSFVIFYFYIFTRLCAQKCSNLISISFQFLAGNPIGQKTNQADQ